MKTSKHQLDRVFLRPQFSLFYRRAPHLRWTRDPVGDYAVMIPLRGTLGFQVKRQKGEIPAGGTLLVGPGEPATVGGHDAEYLALALSSDYVLDCAIRTKLTGPSAAVSFRTNLIERDRRVARLGRDMADELTQEAAGQELVLSALVEQTTIHLLRHHASLKRSPELELSRAGLVDRRLRRAVELMHAQLDRDLPLAELAAAAYLSPFHFSRLFKKLTGLAPHAYLAGLRLARARTMLANTDLSVSEVGERVGYASPSHFTKAFREMTGLTPRAFRRAALKTSESPSRAGTSV